MDVCLTELGRLRRRLRGRVMISFSIALFSPCDQLGQWFLTWETVFKKDPHKCVQTISEFMDPLELIYQCDIGPTVGLNSFLSLF